jgi:hypothetical protein
MLTFKDRDFKSNAIANLKKAHFIFNKIQVPFFLSNGTLLGAIRNKDLIVHDCDTDVGVKIQDWIPQLLEEFFKEGFEMFHEYGTLKKGYQYSLKRNGVKFDIFFYYDEGLTSRMSVWDKEKQFEYVYPLIMAYSDLKIFGIFPYKCLGKRIVFVERMPILII